MKQKFRRFTNLLFGSACFSVSPFGDDHDIRRHFHQCDNESHREFENAKVGQGVVGNVSSDVNCWRQSRNSEGIACEARCFASVATVWKLSTPAKTLAETIVP